MSDTAVPESRVYRHVKCGTETVVAGQSFEVVSNPMSSMTRTWCNHCNAHHGIAEYSWSDTGESIADYYARHSASATDLQRFLCSKKFMVALWIFGFVSMSVAAYFLLANVRPGMRMIFTPLAGILGVVLATALFLSGFADPIKRRVCGVKDTRVLR